MSWFLQEYLQRGLRDIVVVSSHDEEKQDWHGTENRNETAVAKKGTTFVRVQSHQFIEFGPGGANTKSVGESEISEAEYQKAAQGGKVLDTPDERRTFEQAAKKIEQAKKVKKELEAQAPECPVHGKKMKLVRGPKVYFYGCVKGVKCGKKAWLSPEQKRAARVLDKVPPLP